MYLRKIRNWSNIYDWNEVNTVNLSLDLLKKKKLNLQ